MVKPRSDLIPNTADYENLPQVTANGFREYDARWLFGKEINLLGIQALGLGLGTYLHEIGVQPKIVTGHDFRSYSLSIKQALTIGLMRAGCEVHDISALEREPRRAIKAEIETPAGQVRVIATHLGLSIGERRAQARQLLELAGDASMTTVVLGDFNDWFWAGAVRAVLEREFPGRSRFRTFPAFVPVLRLDRIYCRPSHALRASFTDRRARLISDHLPVIADIAPLAG